MTFIVVVATLACIAAVRHGLLETNFLSFIVGAFGALVGLVVLITTVSNRLSFPAQQLQMTQTRMVVERLGCTASEDVLGTALNYNRSVMNSRYYLHRWWSLGVIAPGLDTVKLIEVPSCK